MLAAKVLLLVAPVVENAVRLSDWEHRAFDGSDQGGECRRSEARRG